VEVADRALVRIAGIFAADASGVSDHGLQLLPDLRLGVSEHDGVAVALGHLAAIGARQLGRRSEQDVWLGEHFAAVELVEIVESAGDFAGKFNVRGLILSDGDILRLVHKDIGSLKERIAEEAVGAEVFADEVLLLLLVAGDALEPADRGDHAEEEMQLGVSGYMALDEQDGAGRVESGSKVVENDFASVAQEVGGIGVVGSEGVPIGDEEVALVLAAVLELDLVGKSAHVVAQMDSACRAHAA